MDATSKKPRPRKVAQKQLELDREYNRDHNNRVAARSVCQFTDTALTEDLIVANVSANADIRGYDVITEHCGKFCRVQIRARGRKRGVEIAAKPPRSITFSIIRSKKVKYRFDGTVDVFRRHFTRKEIEAFVFVDVDYRMVFIVPTWRIDLTRTKFTVEVGGQFHDAWHYLKQPKRRRA